MQVRLKVKVEIKGHVMTFGISQKSLFLPSRWLHLTKLSVYLTSPSLCPFGFVPQAVVSDTIAHMVKQFVKLFAIQYGFRFCRYVRLTTILSRPEMQARLETIACASLVAMQPPFVW